jgi:hypothetical protein
MGYGLWVMGYGLWVMGYGLWVMGYGLWVMGYGLWVMGKGRGGEAIRVERNLTQIYTILNKNYLFLIEAE